MAVLLVCGAAFLGRSCGAETDSPQSHPWLFHTSKDLERVRSAARLDPDFRNAAGELLERARTNRWQDLPPLERDWWAEAWNKPWKDTYPEIFHHTYIVPAKWADLARMAARAWLLNSDPRLADQAREVLLSLSDYTFEFEHYDVGMNYALWLVLALEAYDAVHEHFTPAERRRLDAFFERGLKAVQKNDEYWVKHEPGGKLNNHYAWHKLCFCMMGLYYQRPALVEEALNGPKGVWFMFQHGFKDDGLWLEGSIPYQFAATAPLLIMARLLDNAEHPVRLFEWENSDGRSLKQAYDALIPLLFPDRTLPTIGDCYARRPHLGRHPDWEILHRRFGEPAYAWLIADRKIRSPEALFDGVLQLPQGTVPAQASRLWPAMGYAALRTVEGPAYWAGNGWTAFATFSSRPVHEHADKLSLVLFGDGHLWLPDIEARTSAEHPFSANVQGQLNRATLCHNTVLVDGQNQRLPSRPLELVEFQPLTKTKRATFGDLTGQLYPGVRQLRTVVAREEYVLDFFQVSSTNEHEYAWMIHADGTPVSEVKERFKPHQFPAAPPWSYLRNPRISSAAPTYREQFSHGQNFFRIDLIASQPVERIQCGFPQDDSPAPEVMPMRLLRCRAQSAWFCAIYRTGQRELEPLDLTVAQGELSTWRIRVKQAGKLFEHAVPRLEE